MDFNPYHQWLGIPTDEPYATHYQILGISTDEEDHAVIAASAVRQSAYVRNFQKGAHAQDAARILSEIERARLVLLDAKQRKEYDDTLAGQLATKNEPAPPPHKETSVPQALDPLIIKIAAFAVVVTVLIVVSILIYRFTPDGNSVVATSHGIRSTLAQLDLPSTVEKVGPPSFAAAPFNEDVARKHQQAWADFLDLPVEITNSMGMEASTR